MEKFFSDEQERRRLQMVQDDVVDETPPATPRTPVPMHAPRFHRRIRL